MKIVDWVYLRKAFFHGLFEILLPSGAFCRPGNMMGLWIFDNYINIYNGFPSSMDIWHLNITPLEKILEGVVLCKTWLWNRNMDKYSYFKFPYNT